MIEIVEHHDPGDRDLVAAWDSLTTDGACPGLFSTREWVTTWARWFARGRSPLVLIGRDGGSPVGIAPLFASRGLVEFPVNFLSHRGELIAGPGADAFGAAVLTHLRRRGARAAFRSVPVGSATHRAFGEASRAAGYLIVEAAGRVSPYVDIAGTWEEYYASRPRRVTHEWERKMRRLERAGRVLARTLGPDADLERLLADFMDVERRSWKEEEGTSITGRGVEEFYRDLTSSLAACGRLRPFWLEIDGRTAAFVYGASFGGTYFALKTSFDEEYSKLSPGVTLFHEAIRDAFAQGLSRFDFVGQTARWKEEWATGRLEHVSMALYPRTPAGLLAHAVDARVRPLARRLLRRGARS